MEFSIIGYIVYGVILGISEFLPVSASGNEYLYCLLAGIENYTPLLKLLVHMGSLAAVLAHCGKRFVYIDRQLRISAMPAKRRKRQPDLVAVADGRLLLGALWPMILCMVLTTFVVDRLDNLLLLIIMLVFSGILVYIPQHFPGGNRDSKGMSRADSLLLGLLSGLCLIPGLSRLGLTVSAGLLRGCDREYILNTSLMLSGLSLAVLVVMDLLALIFAGTAGITMLVLIVCLISALAAFGISYGCIVLVRYLSVRLGFSAFAFYSWGAAMLAFIIYLIT